MNITYTFKNNDEHFSHLASSYEKVGVETWARTDFVTSSLKVSRDLFTDESLVQRSPIPKELEVYALLSGLPFSQKIVDKLESVQKTIDTIIGDSLCYWVSPSNLGVEYCVFKWPNEVWDNNFTAPINKELSLLTMVPFEFSIRGIQINPDGCIIAKGYDENGAIFKVREQLKNNLKSFPKKQSGWAHIPIGRILEPIGIEKFAQLNSLVASLSNCLIVSDVITSMAFVHETRWYMEEKNILKTLKFD